VLGRDRGAGCGALAKLKRLAKIGLGGRVGTGRQGISWIHEEDLNRLFERALTDATMNGAYIASSPQPVSQAEFMHALRRAIGVPIGLPTPAWLAWIGARFVFRTDPELALYGRYVRSKRLEDEGFRFRFDDINDALRDLFR
jgi:NAD dependent epimerase/dehydratase family enzyme